MCPDLSPPSAAVPDRHSVPSDRPGPGPDQVRITILKLAALLLLVLWMFWPEIHTMARKPLRNSEFAHLLAVTPVALLLLYFRRRPLRQALNRGSAWGIVFLLFGVLMYFCAHWPFSFGYARYVAMIPVLIGVVWVICGWRVLKLCFPIFALVFVSLPVGARIYASLTFRIEAQTITVAASCLDQLPGVETEIKGVDIVYSGDHGTGVVALGESHRAARLFLSFAVVGIFVVFSRIRSLPRLLILALAAVPIVIVCNLCRFLCWALVTIYLTPSPLSAAPRNISTIFSFILVYALCVLFAAARFRLFVEESDDPSAPQEPNRA